MTDCPRLRVLASFFLIPAGFCLCGCTVVQRNVADAVVVTASPSLEEKDVKFVLELRDGREEFAMSEADAFLASKRSARLSRDVRSQIQGRREALRSTVEQARQALSSGCAIIRIDPAKAYADGNMIVYVAGKSDIHVFFSCAEIGQLLALKEVADDLTSVRYTHPTFEAARLRVLRDQVAALGLKVGNVSFSGRELEQMKTEAATRIIERYLRERGLAPPGGPPLLISGLLAPARSPKLTEALKDPSALEQILRSNDPDVLRALVYLVGRKVVELEHP